MYLAAIFSKHYNIPHTRRKNKGGGLSVKDEQTSTNPQKLVLASPLPLKKKKCKQFFVYYLIISWTCKLSSYGSHAFAKSSEGKEGRMRPRKEENQGTSKCVIYHSSPGCSYLFKNHFATCKPKNVSIESLWNLYRRKSGLWCLKSHLSFWGKEDSCLIMLCMWWIRNSGENSCETLYH